MLEVLVVQEIEINILLAAGPDLGFCTSTLKSFILLALSLHLSLNSHRRLGGAQPGNRFVSFVRAYARSGCLVELDQKFGGPAFSLFPFCRARSWGFSFVGPGGFGELSPFPFGPGSFPFSLNEIEVKSN